MRNTWCNTLGRAEQAPTIDGVPLGGPADGAGHQLVIEFTRAEADLPTLIDDPADCHLAGVVHGEGNTFHP